MKRVLLVDDDRDLSELLATQLTRAGYEVRVADSLLGALQVASEGPAFDVLITDLNLPDADGSAVAQALGVPIALAVTGSSSAAGAAELAGFAAVLVKPVSAKQLVDAVSRSLEGAK